VDRGTLAAAFSVELDGRACFLDWQVTWPGGPVRQRYFLRDSAYPVELLIGARAVVFRGSKVVVVRDNTGAHHIQPGGHLEAGETVEAAVRREILEESGWHVDQLVPFCFLFFEPYADVACRTTHRARGAVNVMFTAEAARYDRSGRDTTQIEVGSGLVSIRKALSELGSDQAVLLREATRNRQLG